MQYQIMTDLSGLIVLSYNSRIMMISRDMKEVLLAINDVHKDFINKRDIAVKKLEIMTDDLKPETRTITELKAEKGSKEESDNALSLGRLFGM